MGPNDKIDIFRDFSKRAFDLLISVIGILILLPFFAVLAIIIRISSRGKILHVQNRFGKNGKIFKLLKFTTMHKDADERMRDYLADWPHIEKEWKKFKKLRGFDPRVTLLGKFLRRFSLDELPQLFNVLKGDMSLVGPRPYLVHEEKDIGQFSSTILKVKPGMTGIWQIRGRSELSFESRIEMDMEYVRNRSLFGDIRIVLKTVGVVLRGKGAY